MHRAVAELGDEIDGEQVEVTTNETAQAELARSILPLLMMDDLLPYVAETVHLGNDGNVTVHLAIDLDAFHHLVAIRFQAAVEIVQFDARHHARGPVEELRWNVFGNFRVVTHFFPA